MSKLVDSGARLHFETGAVRDIQAGKGRCDLLPLDIVAAFLYKSELEYIERFKTEKDVKLLYLTLETFAKRVNVDAYTLMLEVSKHFEDGANKYSENNWKKGITLHCYISSAVRHFLKHLRGDTDEPHDRAFVWNILCAAWTYLHKPELDDIELDLIKEE